MFVSNTKSKLGNTAAKVLLLSTAIFATQPSLAQSGEESAFKRDRNISVADRDRPEYQSEGIRNGSFITRAELDTFAAYSDNIFALSEDKVDDTILTFAPSVSVTSDWSSNELRGFADLTHQEYVSNSDESVTGYTIGGSGRYDASRAVSFDAGADYGKDFETRASVQTLNATDGPIEFDRSNIYVGAKREAGRTLLSARLSKRTLDYDDASLDGGTIVDQDFRDQDRVAVEGRAGYAISPDKAIFVQSTYADISHDEVPISGISRDRKTLTGLVGADFELSSLVRGQVGVGFFDTEFDAGEFSDVSGLSYQGKLEWFATPLITATVSGERGTRPSELLISPASTQTDFNLGVDYEYRRNIILSAGYQFSDDNFNFIDRSDQRNTFSVGGVVLLNPNVGVETQLSRRSFDSKGALRQSDFNETELLVGLRFQL